MNKYKKRKVNIYGIKFNSKRESERYSELLILKKAGVIQNLILQPKFQLQEISSNKDKINPVITNIAGFVYTKTYTGEEVVEIIKGE